MGGGGGSVRFRVPTPNSHCVLLCTSAMYCCVLPCTAVYLSIGCAGMPCACGGPPMPHDSNARPRRAWLCRVGRWPISPKEPVNLAVSVEPAAPVGALALVNAAFDAANADAAGRLRVTIGITILVLLMGFVVCHRPGGKMGRFPKQENCFACGCNGKFSTERRDSGSVHTPKRRSQ